MEKKPVVSLGDWLYDDGVFTLSTTVNYNDKIVMYERGIVKTEIIDGKEFTGREPKEPYIVIELDKKTGKKRVYKAELVEEEDLGTEFASGFSKLYEEVDINSTGTVNLYKGDFENEED